MMTGIQNKKNTNTNEKVDLNNTIISSLIGCYCYFCERYVTFPDRDHKLNSIGELDCYANEIHLLGREIMLYGFDPEENNYDPDYDEIRIRQRNLYDRLTYTLKYSATEIRNITTNKQPCLTFEMPQLTTIELRDLLAEFEHLVIDNHAVDKNMISVMVWDNNF